MLNGKFIAEFNEIKTSYESSALSAGEKTGTKQKISIPPEQSAE